MLYGTRRLPICKLLLDQYVVSLLNSGSFLRQLDLAVTKIRELKRPHKIVSDEYVAYMKQPTRDTFFARRLRTVECSQF
jgi:hypothetical protein